MAIAWALARVNANAKISGNIFSRIIRLINALYVQLKINLFFGLFRRIYGSTCPQCLRHSRCRRVGKHLPRRHGEEEIA